MKMPLLFVSLLFTMVLTAQLPKGVTLIDKNNLYCTFIFKDASGSVWMGYADPGTAAKWKGLKQYRNGQLVKRDSVGMFTDAMQVGGTMFFTADRGLYTYRNDSLLCDKKITRGSCLVSYKNVTWIGTMGLGLWETKNGALHPKLIRIKGVAYDSVYSMAADGNVLWIGTTKGLVKYEADSFRLVPVPMKKTGDVFYDAPQIRIRSLQMDGYGQLWIMNDNRWDTFPCIYIMNKGTFKELKSYYREMLCSRKGMIPGNALRFGRTEYGHILIGSGATACELSEQVTNYALSARLEKEWQGFRRSNGVGTPICFAYEAPDRKLYASTGDGILEIDRSVYDLESALNQLNVRDDIAYNTIDLNDLDANIASDGAMFGGGDLLNELSGKPFFKTKSTGCPDLIYSAGLWMGGINKATGDLNIAAQTYRQVTSGFLPGPINIQTQLYDSSLARQYNKIWKIDRKTIDEFFKKRGQQGYQIPQAILDWPGNAPAKCRPEMAPYVDIDNNTIYEPAKGDYPKIKGDQMLWWVFNAMGHLDDDTVPGMMMQVNAMAYVYKDIRLTPKDSDFLVNRSLFFEYGISNVGNVSYNDFYIGLMNDIDIGNYWDDWVGIDTAENSIIGYNNDKYDEGLYGFGENSPIVTCKFLNRKMDYFKYYFNDNSYYGNPSWPTDYYAYMQSGFWDSNGDSIIKDRYLSIPGYPCSKPLSSGGVGRDTRILMSSGTKNFAAGQSINLAFVYSVMGLPDEDFRQGNCDVPKKNMKKLQQWYDKDAFPSKPYWTTGIAGSSEAIQLKIYPNPATSSLYVSGLDASNASILQIENMQGQSVLSTGLESGLQTAELNISGLSSGVYIVRVHMSDHEYVMKLIKQ